jgi:hypothetical protein
MLKKKIKVVPAVIPFPSDDVVWTPDDVAAFLKLANSDAVYELTRKRSKNPLPSRRVGKQIRFSKTEVMAWFYKKVA